MGDFLTSFMNDVKRVVLDEHSSGMHSIDDTEASVAELIAVKSYDREAGLYATDNQLGFVAEVTPSGGINETGENQLIGLMSILERLGKFSIQVSLLVMPSIEDQLQQFAAQRQNADGIVDVMSKERLETFRQAASFGLSDDYPWRIRSQRVLISVFSSNRARLADELVSVQGHVGQLLEAVGAHHFRILPPEVLLKLLASLYMPEASQRENLSNLVALPSRKYWEHDYFNTQVSRAGKDLLVQHDRLSFSSGMAARAFVVSDVPESYPPGSMAGLLGDLWQTRMLCPYAYMVTTTLRPSGMMQEMIGTKNMKTAMSAASPLRFLSPGIAMQASDLDLTARRLDEGDGLANLFMQAVVYAPSDEIDDAERSLNSLFTHNGFGLSREDGLQLPSFMAAMPAGNDRDLLKSLDRFNRSRTVLSRNAICFLPLFGEWQGNAGLNNPALLILAGRRGGIAGWSPKAAGGNYNVSVIGKSGGGKSVLMQEMMFGLIATGGAAIVLDDGNSFENSCKFMGGTHVDFARADLELNPFAVLDAEEMRRNPDYAQEAIAMLTQMLGSMCQPGKVLEDLARAIITMAVQRVWDQFGNRGTIDEVAKALKNAQIENDKEGLKRASEMAGDFHTMLLPFKADGPYGTAFNAGCNLDFSNDMTVFEMRALRNKPDMLAAVMMLIMFMATEKMFRSDRNKMVGLFIDEGWAMLAGAGSEYIGSVARRARKYSGMLVTGTQSANDYFGNDAARACWDNSNWRIFMAQEDSSITALKNEEKVDVSPTLERALRSLTPINGLWSELVIHADKGFDIFRLILDPQSVTAFSSTGDDVERLNTLVAQGKNHADAIKLMSEEIAARRLGKKNNRGAA